MTDFNEDFSIPDDLAKQIASELQPDLKSTSIEEGIERYLNHRRTDITTGTRDEYENKLSKFQEFCNLEGKTDLNDIDGRDLDDYENWLRLESSDIVDELSPKTMRDELYLFRDFLSYMEGIEAVKPNLSNTIDIPELDQDEGIRNVDLDPERVEQILEYLDTYHYASLDHLTWLLTTRIGRRQGAFIGLDVSDAHLQIAEPHLEFVHRPPSTRLKNGEDGEEHVAITDEEAQVIADYIDRTRPDVRDESGRRPLVATQHGRVSPSTFRRIIYKWSRPCQIGEPCPHDRDPDKCKATKSADHASKCPSSRSPHALRHGYISEGRRQGVPIDVLSDRCDVSPEVIRAVYDESTKEERREARREILDDYATENSAGYL